MTVGEVLDFYGDITVTAHATGITYQAVHRWVKKGEIPQSRQYHLESLTGGKLLAANDGTQADKRSAA